MSELYKNSYMVVSVSETSSGSATRATISLVWAREEPDDGHASTTAHAVAEALTQYCVENPNSKLRFLLDLSVVSRTFPRATATYASWMLSHRSFLSGVAFCTKSFFLRAGVSAALLVPGLKVKGFKDAESAREFLTTF